MMLHGDSAHGSDGHPPEYDLDDFHIHAQLTISIDGEIVDIPANLSISQTGLLSHFHTHELDNVLHLESVPGLAPPDDFLTLGDFFEVWRTKGGVAGNNPDAVLTSTQILGNFVDDENDLKMFVNGVESTEFEDYQIRAGDNIVLAYGDNPVVTFQTNQGPILIELFPDVAPITVGNFLNYVNDGDYTNSIFHRLVSGFVLQGGGFTSDAEEFTSAAQFESVPTDPPIQNEFQLSNLRGTIAMAKVGGNPDSATSQWFVNLGDNSANLDNQNGGFTVFGQVLGMSTGEEGVLPSTVDLVAGFSTTNAGGAFTDLPLNSENHIVRVESIGGEGIVRGTVFVDANANQTFDDGEAGIESVVVFVDTNQNGTLDAGEMSTVTVPSGDYMLRLPAGPHVIRQVVEAPFLQTSPTAPDSYVVTVLIGSETVDVDFGNAELGANDDSFEVLEDSVETVLDVLANDSVGGASENLSIAMVGDTDQGGVVTVSPDNLTIVYTPAADFTGTETFTYTVSGPNGSEEATVLVDVLPVNDPPTAVDDEFTVNENQATDLTVLDNDLTDPDTGETLRVIALLTQPEMGTVAIINDGQAVRFTPPQGFIGTQSFTYNISDRATGGLTSSAVVTINVVEVNDPPTASPDSFTVEEDSVAVELDVLANDSIEPDVNETLSILSVDAASFTSGGSATVSSDGLMVLYTPAADFFGMETFAYTVQDSRGGTAQGTVTMTVTPVNDPPMAVDDAFTFTKDTGPHELDVLANDVIAPDEDEALMVIDVSVPSEAGTVQVVGDGQQIEYTPAAGFTGDAAITYTIDDGNGGTDTATATVTIRDFVPSRLSGFVYFDRNDNGVFDEGEAPIGGVTITLDGSDDFGEAVGRTAATRADGSYAFEDLAPGSYTVAQTQPDQVLDGRDTIGSQGGDVADDSFTITLAEGVDGSGNNFGELGRSAHFVGLRNFFAIRNEPLVLSAINESGQLWYSARPDWSNYDNVSVSLTDDTLLYSIEVNANGNPQNSDTTPIEGDDRTQILGRNDGTTILGLMAASADFGFTAPDSGAMAVAAAMAAGEFGADSADLAARDSAFEEMGM